MKITLRRVLAYTTAGLIVFVAMSFFLAQKLTGAHHRGVGAAPAALGSCESITLNTADGLKLSGWYLPAKSDTAIVLLHGYAGDRRQMLPRAKWFRDQGHAVLLYDARACGESDGDCISFGWHETGDLLAALEFVKGRGAERIACVGMSQGGATVLLAADRLPVETRCVICESAFDQLATALDNRFRSFTLLPRHWAGCLMVPFGERRLGASVEQIKPLDHISRLKMPVFIISGEDDPRTTAEDTRRLFDAAPDPKELWLIPGAGHHDLFWHGQYKDRMTIFLDKHLR